MGTGAAVAVVTLAGSGERPQDSARSPGVLVTRVIDGDTLVIADGRHVRLIGIDTPEKDECGYRAATVALRELVEGRRVRLPNPRSVQDQDRYDRLLRYVDLGK